MFGGLAQLVTSRRSLITMPFSTTLSTTLSREKQGSAMINEEQVLPGLKGLGD
jgi:hypothetical protein